MQPGTDCNYCLLSILYLPCCFHWKDKEIIIPGKAAIYPEVDGIGQNYTKGGNEDQYPCNVIVQEFMNTEIQLSTLSLSETPHSVPGRDGMQHDEDRERDLHDEEDDVEDDQHEGGPAGPLHPAVG